MSATWQQPPVPQYGRGGPGYGVPGRSGTFGPTGGRPPAAGPPGAAGSYSPGAGAAYPPPGGAGQFGPGASASYAAGAVGNYTPGAPGGYAPPAPAGPTSLAVSGCNNITVSNIIKGTYSPSGTNHGKPVYKKEGAPGSVSVLIYFWDERDGPSFSGWWFGPKVGGDQVWAYNAATTAATPPPGSWKVPWDGPADPSLQLTPVAHPPGPARVGPGHAEQAAAATAQRMAEEERRRKEMERQRQVAEQMRQAEERRSKEEEARRRATEERRREEEARRKEMQAATAVRKVIQRVRVATPETYDALVAELEEVQNKNLEAMGSQADKVSQEAEKTLQQAQKRIDEINHEREEEVKRAQEEERRRKEEAEQVAKIMREAEDEVKEAEAKVAEAQGTSDGVDWDSKTTTEALIEAAEITEKVVEESIAALEKVVESLAAKEKEMGHGEAFYQAKQDFREFDGRLHEGKKSLEKLLGISKAARERARKKSVALAKLEVRKQLFSKHDTDQDGQLSRQEVVAFGKSELDFDVSEEVLDRIMKILGSVTFEKFRAMHQKIAIVKSEVQIRALRAEEEAKRKVLEEQRLEAKKIVDTAVGFFAAAEESLGKAEAEAKPLTKEQDLPADQIKEVADAAEVHAKKADEQLAEAMVQITRIKDACAANEGLQSFEKKDIPRLTQRHERAKGRGEKVCAALGRARDRAIRKEYAEIDQKRTESVAAIRARMGAEGKTGEQLFAEIDGGAALTREKFVSLLAGLDALKLQDGDAGRLFDHISGEGGAITQERFLELIRLYYKCVKSTVLSEDISIKSKTLRRLDIGEVLEALEGPATEEGAKVERVKCRSVQDDQVGWVTICGNQGTPFLEPGGNFYSCVKDTLLTDGHSVTESKTVRRIAKGEVIEVLEFHKKDASVDVQRIRGKAKLDGAAGWITVCSNQGAMFLEPC